MEKKDCYVFDMDFTIADSSPRDQFKPDDPSRTENWSEWNRQAHLDQPIEYTMNILKALKAVSYEICIATVRSDAGFDETAQWLATHGLPDYNLFMRVEGDNRSAPAVKGEILEEIRHEFNVLGIFDDDPSVVKHLRSLGYKVFQV